MLWKMPHKGEWIVTDSELITANMKSSDPAIAAAAKWFYDVYNGEYQKNPLQLFLAHGGAIDFINDMTSQLAILWAGNQDGKSYALLCKLGLCAIKNDPNWHCFQFNKLVPRKWDGPKRIMVCSYEWLHIRTNLWPKLAAILPVDELREYSPKWTGPMAKRKFKVPTDKSPSVKLACKTILDFYCYRQPPECFESATYDYVFCDEQPPVHVHEGAFMRGQNQLGFQENISCTPHQVKGLAYTGAGSWIHRAWDGVDTKGMSIGKYRIQKDQIPDAIQTPEQKKATYHRLIEAPQLSGDMKQIREGRSRYYGLPESSEGLVVGSWIPCIHWITPFAIPKHWTQGRAIDPGEKDPCAVLWWAMSEHGELVITQEYYEKNRSIYDNAKAIIQKSGNTYHDDSPVYDNNGNVSIRRVEDFTGQEYLFTVMDGRTFKQPARREAGLTLGQVWASAGLRCIPASGMHNREAWMLVNEWFSCTQGVPHILVRMGIEKQILGPSGLPATGAPRIYVFNTCHHFREELESYVNNADKPNEPAPNQQDHSMSALKYLVLAGPRYCGPSLADLSRKDNEDYYEGRPKKRSRFSYA